MTSREQLCDLFDIPYTTDDETLYDCALKYIKDTNNGEEKNR